MTIVSIIVAVDEANGIGQDNELLTYLPADLLYFKSVTMGKPIIMGRTTYDSIGKPLPGRTNIVLSRSIQFIPGVSVVYSLDEALKQAGNIPEVMIIGGSQLYAQSIAIAHRLYVTKIHHHFKADVFFPKINETTWHCHSNHYRHKDEKNQYDMTFCVYERELPVI
jgi:dihydrofolate reductase